MRTLASAFLALLLLSAHISAQPHLISLDVRDAALSDVIFMLAVQAGRNIVTDDSIRRDKVTLHVHDSTFEAVLGLLARLHDLHVRHEGSVYLISARVATMQLRRGAPTQRPTPSVRHSAVNSGHAIALRFARPSQILASLSDLLPSATYVADDVRRSVLVTGGAEVQSAAQSLLRSADIPGPRVVLDMRVADVQLQDQQPSLALKLGGGGPAAGTAGYAFTRNTRALDSDLHDLSSAGRLKMLAAATLVTPSGHESGLLIGRQYPAVVSNAPGGIERVQLVEVGFRLRLKSTIERNGCVTAALHPLYSSVDTAAGDAAVVVDRQFDATLCVHGDETIVLGGLFAEIDAQTLTKLPSLGDIPVLGAVVRARRHQRPRDEIVLLITPRVVEGSFSKPRARRGSRFQ